VRYLGLFTGERVCAEAMSVVFSGRRDVCAVQVPSPKGRHGVRYVPHRVNGARVPVTLDTYADHLAGRATMAVYPLAADGSCQFAVANFNVDGRSPQHTEVDMRRALDSGAARTGTGGYVY